MKIEKSILAMMAFAAAFFAVLAEARLGQPRTYYVYNSLQDERFDDTFDQGDESMFDKHWYRKPDFSSVNKKASRRTQDEMFDDTFDQGDESMFDTQTRYVKKAPKGRFNQKGYVVRKNLGGGKGNPKVKDPQNWIKQTSYGEGKRL